MFVGYARTSTVDQVAGLEAQLQELQQAGCQRLYNEQVSSIAIRAQLEAALDFVRDGDTLVATKLDRLARSSQHLWELVRHLDEKGVALRILNLGGDTVDTRGATGRLILNMFAAMAQFEREMMLERQRDGIAKAKSQGRYKGRKPTARVKAPEVLRYTSEGKSPSEIAKILRIGRASVYRALNAAAHSPEVTP